MSYKDTPPITQQETQGQFNINICIMQINSPPKSLTLAMHPGTKIADLRVKCNTITREHHPSCFGKLLNDNTLIKPGDRIDFLLNLICCPLNARKKRLANKRKQK